MADPRVGFDGNLRVERARRYHYEAAILAVHRKCRSALPTEALRMPCSRKLEIPDVVLAAQPFHRCSRTEQVRRMGRAASLPASRAVAEKIRLDMNSRVLKAYPIKAYNVEIVGNYDGDHYATMTPVYDA
mgnify:CR=1 FL=1